MQGRSTDTRHEFFSREEPAHSSEMCCDASNEKLRKLPACHATVIPLARHTREGGEKARGKEMTIAAVKI